MITIAVLYNVFFVIARSVFWDMTHNLWMIFDYTADFIYLMDLFVRFTNLLVYIFVCICFYICICICIHQGCEYGIDHDEDGLL